MFWSGAFYGADIAEAEAVRRDSGLRFWLPAWSIAAVVRRFFFPPRCFEPAGLEEGVGDHRPQGVPMQPNPGSALEMVKPEFLFELLVRLFTDPPGFNRGGQHLDRGVGRQVRGIIFGSIYNINA